MKLTKREASEKEKAPGAIYKRLEGGEKKKDEATSEEAAERRTQQECSLSGGVYLRHRLRKSSFSLIKTDFPEKYLFPPVWTKTTRTCYVKNDTELFFFGIECFLRERRSASLRSCWRTLPLYLQGHVLRDCAL